MSREIWGLIIVCAACVLVAWCIQSCGPRRALTAVELAACGARLDGCYQDAGSYAAYEACAQQVDRDCEGRR